MNIWIFNHYAGPPTAANGTRHYALARRLVGRGHTVTIFASSFNHWTLREEHLGPWQAAREETIDGVRFVWVRTIPYQGGV